MENKTIRDLNWFKKRIGKRIFRDPDNCKCPTCKDVVKNGLIVANKNHAEYLAMTDNDFEREGIKLNYRDKQ